MRPMLASPTTSIPNGEGWLHEVKWDGMRVLADVHEGRLTLTSRIGNDVTASYPELAGLAGELREAGGHVVAAPGGQDEPALVDVGEDAHAVQLDLVEPSLAGGHRRRWGGRRGRRAVR